VIKSPTPEGRSAAERLAAFSMMTSAATWQQLTSGAGWSFDEAEEWLATSPAQLPLRRGR